MDLVRLLAADFGSLVVVPNLNQRVAIVLDGVVVVAPTIHPGFEDAPPSVEISGDFPEERAEEIVTTLNAAARAGTDR